MNKTGFGFMRLPHTADDQIDFEKLNRMVDRFFALGGDYFDTAYNYLKGESEKALRKTVVERYERERFRIADKLPGYQVTAHEQCRTLFDEQLERCGVTYFDVYLLHFLNPENYAIAEKYDEFGFLREIKASGEARKIGFSFHGTPELLDTILTAHPEVEVVLLQINYLDWDSASIRAREQYETAVRHGKEVLIMEPVRGGQLAKVPPQAQELLCALRPQDSVPSWAIRFATNLEHASVVLSGMNTMEQLEDNLRHFDLLTAEESDALNTCATIIRAETAVSCTACGYCVSHCPNNIPIPSLFAMYNEARRVPSDTWKVKYEYDQHVPASACIICHACEKHCPQKLRIADTLKDVAATFEKKE